MHARSYCLECSPWGTRNSQQLEKLRRDGLKTCAGACGRDLPVQDFNKKSGVCRPCLALHARTESRDRKVEAVEYLGGKCERCGYDKCPAAMDFHHRDPTQKDFTVSRRSRSTLEALKPELNKCELLCRNCHAEHHFTSP